jgi:hypothetical protein
MADDATEPLTAVRLALDRAGTSWRQLTEEGRQIFIRTAVRQVRYDGRTGQVTVQFKHAGKHRQRMQQIESRKR